METIRFFLFAPSTAWTFPHNDGGHPLLFRSFVVDDTITLGLGTSPGK